MISVYVIAYNRPDLLPHQARAFRRHLREEHQMVVINNGIGRMRWQLHWAARKQSLAVRGVRSPNHSTANYSHARALEFAYQRFVRHERDIAIVVDHDVFPCGSFSARALLGDAAIAGALESKSGADGRTVHYLHPGLVLLDVPALPGADQLSFWPDRVDGVSCDVGGHLWEYFRAHPELRIRLLSHQPGSGQGAPETFGGFVHYRGASDWDHQGPAHHARKTAYVLAYLGAAPSRVPERPTLATAPTITAATLLS